MRCTICGNPTARKEKVDHAYTTERVYRCRHGHITRTVEVLPAALSAKASAEAERGAIARAEKWQRDQVIRADLLAMPATHVARKHDLTEARIRQIRKTYRIPEGDTNANLRAAAQEGGPRAAAASDPPGIIRHRCR